MKIAPKWCPHRNIANQTDSKVSTNQIWQPISSLPCRRVIQHPKSYPNIQLQITRPQIAEKSRFFCKFDVHSPGGLRPEIVRQQWKILYFSSPNFCLFQSQITFRSIILHSIDCFCHPTVTPHARWFEKSRSVFLPSFRERGASERHQSVWEMYSHKKRATNLQNRDALCSQPCTFAMGPGSGWMVETSLGDFGSSQWWWRPL